MNHYVYIVTNLMNGKKYIGKRSCRCPIEEDKYMGSGYILAKAKEKYGIKNFKKEILLVCETEEKVLEEEKREIERVNATKNPMYYNVAEGGQGGNTRSGFTKQQMEEYRKKLSKASMGRKIVRRKKIKKEKRKPLMITTKSVVCLNTCEVFYSPTKASIKYNISCGNISNVCKGRNKSAGRHPITGQKLAWRYLDEYEQYSVEEINNIVIQANTKTKTIIDRSNFICKEETKVKISEKLKGKMAGEKNPRAAKIICLNTNEIFDYVGAASNKYNLSSSNISKVCRGKLKSNGKHPVTGEPLKWMYLEDYRRMTKEDIEEILVLAKNSKKGENNPSSRKVVCLNEKKVFDTLKKASEWCNLKSHNSVGAVCRGKRKSAGKHPETGEKLVWMYLEDYENKYGKINKEIF